MLYLTNATARAKTGTCSNPTYSGAAGAASDAKCVPSTQCFQLELCTEGCVHPGSISLPAPPSPQALGKFTASQQLKGFTPRCNS